MGENIPSHSPFLLSLLMYILGFSVINEAALLQNSAWSEDSMSSFPCGMA